MCRNGDVETFNARIPSETDGTVHAVPLVFNNAGTTVAYFRAMLEGGHGPDVAAQLAEDAARLGYGGLQVDWEPSCWAATPETCTWPSKDDALGFRHFLGDLAQVRTVTAADRIM